MKTTGCPFAFIDGQAYIIRNFTMDPSHGFPSIRQMLEGLLGAYPGTDILLLRKLSEDEARILGEATTERDAEVWAQIRAMSKDKEE